MDGYVIGRVIGHGGFSVVRCARRIADGQTVAVKVVPKSAVDRARQEYELALWASLDHPHLVRMEKILETQHAVHMVCFYCDGGSLLHLLDRQTVDETLAKTLFTQICLAVQYLHHQVQVCHLDLKLDNVLLDACGQIKICDFGLSRHWSSVDTCAAGGSLAYAAPEQIRLRQALVCPKTDVWSLGVILFALVAGHLPFEDGCDLRLQQKIVSAKPTWPVDLFTPQLQDLLHHLLEPNSRARFTVDQALQSAWLRGA